MTIILVWRQKTTQGSPQLRKVFEIEDSFNRDSYYSLDIYFIDDWIY